MRTKPKLRRICAFLLALVVLFTTCFADLPEGSLSFLGGIGEQIVSALSNDEVEAASTYTKITLTSKYGSASISEISRYSEGMWFFTRNSDTGSEKTLFCMNSGKALHSSDSYKYTTTNAVTYSNQSLAKAMTWWFGSTSRGCMDEGGYNNGSSYGSLTAAQTQAAVQGYVWACQTSGASKETTVRQILTNYCGLSYAKAASYAKSIVNAISNTYVYGTIYYYTLSSCGKGSSSTHQTMLSWSSYGTYTTDSYSTSDSTTGKVTITIEIDKKDKTTGALIDTAKFKATYGGKLLKNATSVSITSGSITSATVSTTTGSYDKDTSYFTTKGGKVKFTFTVNFKTKTYKTKEYKYVVNWDELDYWTQKELSEAGYYQNKAKAQAAANTELASGLANYRSSAINSIRGKTITVTEKSAPDGHGFSSTSTLSKTAKNSVSLTYEFSNPAKYGKVTVTKKEGDTSNYDSSYSPMKGAVYGVYAAETIYDTDNKTVLYKKNELIKKITTNSSGVASTSNILPVGYDYYVKEIEAPDGWELDTTKHKFSITLDSNGNVESATVTSTEDHEQEMYYGAVSVIKSAKRDESYIGDDATLKGAEYSVYAAETIYDVDGTTVLYNKGDKVTSATITTNASGYGKSASVIPAGDDSNGYKYYLKETKASTGYVKDTTKYYFYVRVNSSHTVTVKDADGKTVNGSLNSGNAIKSDEDSIWGKVEIYKYTVDANGNNTLEKGAKFALVKASAVLSATGTSSNSAAAKKINNMSLSERKSLVSTIKKSDSDAVLTTLTTNANGYASYSPVPKGTYFLIQTAGDEDYELTQDYFSITSGTGTSNIKTRNLYNEINPAYINITKTKSSLDSSGNLVEEAEEDAVFYVLYASKVSKTLAQLNAMTSSERQAYVNSLSSSAIKAKLTTDEEGEASVKVDAGTAYIILQVSGDPYCELANADKYTFAADEVGTYYYEATNPEHHTKFSIVKTLSDALGSNEEPEEGATFAVIKSSYVTKTAAELNAMDASARAAYVKELTDADSSSILATLITDEDGTAEVYWNDSDYEGDFVVIQTVGTDGYALMPAAYSSAATSTGLDSSGNAVMTKKTGTDSNGLGYTYYSFEYTDMYESSTDFTITKTLIDTDGNNDGAEEGAAFAVIKSSYVTKTAAEINVMTEDERAAYVEDLEDADSSCIIATLTTSSEGDATVSWSDSDYNGDFVVIQTAGTDGYALMPATYSADATSTGLDGSENAVMKVTTDGKTTSYSFSYADEFVDWAKIAVQKKYESANGTWENEAGATFSVLDQNGEAVAWITTDSTGYGVALDASGNEAALPFGIYYVHQTGSGNGADNTSFIDDELVILTKSDREATVLYEAQNPAEDYDFTLTKLSDDTNAPVEGATYTIKANGDIYASDDSIEYPSGTTVATIITDENGQGTTKLPYGSYYIEESSSPYNFVKNTEKVYFTLDASGITVSGGKTSAATLVTETDEEGNTFSHYEVTYTTYDTPVYGTIYVTKDGQVVNGLASEGGFTYTSTALEGAVFALYARNEIKDDAGNVVWEAGEYITSATTDSTGTAQFYWDKDGESSNGEESFAFYLGDYYVVETYAPPGYVLDKTEHDISLTWDKTPSTENEMADAGSVSDTGEAGGAAVTHESSGKYVLMTGSSLNELIKDAVSVTFTWSSPADGTTTTDVSHDGDGSIVMWNDGAGNYYISSQDLRQAVIFNGDSSYMFANCSSLKEVRFDSVDTSKACDMSYMFYMCTLLTELDLTEFDTTNVEAFDYMFCGCTSLVTIYVTEPGATGTDTESVYHTDTWTTGVTASAVGPLTDGDDITWENFSYTRLYTADYIVEDVEEDITLSASDIASITPSVTSQDDDSVVWIDDNTYTMDVEITLAEGCAYYCTDGTYSNTMTVTVTVLIPEEVEVEAEESPMATLALSNTPVTVNIEVYKVDGNGDPLAGAVFTLYANCDIKNADGETIIKAGEAIMESETLGEAAPVLTFSGLPTDLYAVDGTYLQESGDAVYCYADGTTGSSAKGESMFYVKETTVPPGHTADGHTYYLTGALSDYDADAEDADGTITYTFTAINTELTYLTLQKAWNDGADSSSRPEYVVFKATADGGTSYVIVMYEDKAYLFTNNGTGGMIYNLGVTSTSYLSRAICYWDTEVTTEGSGSNAVTVWSVALDNHFTLVSGNSSFTSPFTATSGYTFAENADLLKSMTINAAQTKYYTVKSEGWTSSDKLVWRTTNYISDSPYYTNSTVTKYWDDSNNEMEVRPESISVTLYQEDVKGNATPLVVRTLSEENDWTYSTADDTASFKDGLDKTDANGNAYTYYWTESTASFPTGYTQTAEKTWYDEDTETWYTEFTNSITVTIPVSVEKIWDDDSDAQGIRPTTIYMRLYADGVWVDVNGNAVTSSTTADTAVALTADNEWKATLYGLPKYNSSGKEITYKFAELTYSTDLIIGGKKVTPAESEFAAFTESKTTGYLVSTSYNGAKTTVTNTHTPSGEVTVYKKVLASDISLYGSEPEVTFTLTASDGTIYEKTITFTQDYVASNMDASGYVTASATFTSLDYGTYTLAETEVPDGWEFVSLTSSNGTVSGEKVKFTISSSNVSESFEATFENEFITEGGVTVYKKVLASEIDWDEGDPEFTFTLTASDGTSSEKTITFTEDYVTANTDASGYVTASATFPSLEYGTYTLAETEAPDRWTFVSLTSSNGTVSGETATFTISKSNSSAEFEAVFINEYNAPGSAVVYKKVRANDINWDEGEPSFSFTLTNPDSTTTTKTVTITKLYADANTDAEGYVTISATFPSLDYGTYTLEETKMPEEWEFVSLTCADGTVSGKKATFTISKANAQQAVEATYVNEYNQPGDVTVYKKVLASSIDWTSGDPEFTFTLTASDGTSEKQTITLTEDYVTANTDTSGYVTASATFTNLSYGTYTLEETEVPDGWKFVSITGSTGTVNGESVTFTINKANASESFEATFTNEYNKPGEVTVYKKVLASDVSLYGGEPKFTFTLTDSDENTTRKSITFTQDYVTANTDAYGYVTASATFTNLSYGTYTLEETDMPEGWEFVSLTSSNGTVSGESAEFTISSSNASESFEAAFVNEYITEGGVTVYKKILASEIDWTKGNPEFAFTLTASDGTTVTKSATFTQDYVTANTDADGYVTASTSFPSLEYGTYTLEETEAPDRWTFVSLTSSTGTVSGESVTFTISKANASESFEATFTNEYNAPGEAVVYKKVLASEIDWTKGNPEFTFTLTDPDNATTTKTITLTQDYVAANTDTNGYVTASATFTELEYGEYTLEETAMPDRWSFVSLTASDGTVSGKTVTFTISKANATAAFEATYTNEYNALGEAVVYKKVLASEIDWTKGNPEFTFTLTDPDNATTTKTITLTQDYVAANTDTNGYVTASATFTELEYGEYTLEETNMPDNWSFVSLTASDGTVSGKSVAFTISKANATAAFEATFLNQYDKPGNLTVYKKILASDIDWTDGNPEFTFTLTASDGSSVNKTITFTESYVTANMDADGYVTASASFTEVVYGTYTLKETKMPVGWKFVSLTSSTGTVSGESVTFTISRENASTAFEATFVDERDRSGKITIIKYGSDGKTVLSGVTFAISDEDGNLVDTQTTDENGQVVFDGLEIGTYRICETATVSGYSLLADEITATIPLVLTQEEIDAYEADGVHVDVTNASVRDGEYYFYELTYEVKDTWNLDLPSTGSTGTMPKLLLVFGFMLLASALLVFQKRGRKSR